jgi:hypothetical protein
MPIDTENLEMLQRIESFPFQDQLPQLVTDFHRHLDVDLNTRFK